MEPTNFPSARGWVDSISIFISGWIYPPTNTPLMATNYYFLTDVREELFHPWGNTLGKVSGLNIEILSVAFTSKQACLQYFSSGVEWQRVGQQGFSQETQVDERSEVRGQVVRDDLAGPRPPGQHGLMEEAIKAVGQSITPIVCPFSPPFIGLAVVRQMSWANFISILIFWGYCLMRK